MHHKKLVMLSFLAISLLGHCKKSPEPTPRHVSNDKLASISADASMSDVQDRLGSPSFVWPSRVFVPQHYPNTPACAVAQPRQMWVYYERNSPSGAVFFDARDKVVCHERILIVIAY